MTEEQTEQTTTTETETKTYSKEQYDSLKGNLVGQIGDLKGELDTFKTQAEERAKQDADAENARLAENNQHKELFEKSQTEFNEKVTTFEGQLKDKTNENDNLHKQIDLLKAGVTDDEQSEFLIYKYNKLEDAGDFSEWLTAQNVVKNTGKSSGNVGNVSSKSKGTIEQRLNSSDPQVVRDALKDQLKSNMGLG